MRIDQFLSHTNCCLRSKAAQFLKQHEVSIDQVRIKQKDFKFEPSQQTVTVDGDLISYELREITLAIHKPTGYLSSTVDGTYPSLLNLLQEPYDTVPFGLGGRLDADVSGLMILSTDGKLLHHLITPKNHVEKEYLVALDRPFNPVDGQKMLLGITIKDGDYQPYLAVAKAVSLDPLGITLVSGKFHQVKRMFEHFGYTVTKLARIRIGRLKLDLAPGEYREITSSDLWDD